MGVPDGRQRRAPDELGDRIVGRQPPVPAVVLAVQLRQRRAHVVELPAAPVDVGPGLALGRVVRDAPVAHVHQHHQRPVPRVLPAQRLGRVVRVDSERRVLGDRGRRRRLPVAKVDGWAHKDGVAHDGPLAVAVLQREGRVVTHERDQLAPRRKENGQLVGLGRRQHSHERAGSKLQRARLGLAVPQQVLACARVQELQARHCRAEGPYWEVGRAASRSRKTGSLETKPYGASGPSTRRTTKVCSL